MNNNDDEEYHFLSNCCRELAIDLNDLEKCDIHPVNFRKSAISLIEDFKVVKKLNYHQVYELIMNLQGEFAKTLRKHYQVKALYDFDIQ